MKLVPTNRTDYGLRALIYLANAPSQWTKAAEIGSAMAIPVGFLQIILQDLQRSKLVTSRSGPRGGYASDAHPNRSACARSSNLSRVRSMPANAHCEVDRATGTTSARSTRSGRQHAELCGNDCSRPPSPK